MEFKIISPYSLKMGVRKIRNYTINMNTYRNLHYHVENDLKALYSHSIKDQIKTLPELNKPQITYTVFYPDKRDRDKSNFCCIHEKYFCDALVEQGKLPDDCDKYLGQSVYIYGGIDRDNPRCEIVVKCKTT